MSVVKDKTKIKSLEHQLNMNISDSLVFTPTLSQRQPEGLLGTEFSVSINPLLKKKV